MTCDWCGEAHAVTALCRARPRWSRRGFLSVLGWGVAAAAIAPLVSLAPEAIAPVSGTIGAINRATFAFWRNQSMGQIVAEAWEREVLRRPDPFSLSRFYDSEFSRVMKRKSPRVTAPRD